MWHHRHEATPTSTKMTVLQSWRYLVDCSVGRSCPEFVWIHCLETWVGSLRLSDLLIFFGWFGRAWLGFVWFAHLVWLRLVLAGLGCRLSSTVGLILASRRFPNTFSFPKNTGNRQKEQVTREHGCPTLPHLLKCFAYERTTQETARKSKLPVNLAVLFYLTCWSASPTNEQHRKPPERASYLWLWLCYFTSIAAVLPELDTNRPPWLGPALLP